MIRVAVSARSPVVRAGLEAVVREDPELATVAREDADVLLVSAGAESAVDLPAPGEPALVLVSESDAPEVALAALRAGARAVLPPDAPKEEIRAAIHAAAAGLIALRPQELTMLLAAAPAPADELAPDGAQALSPRELEILRMLADGMANKTIAWKLGISEHTVKFHVAAILNRLNAASRTEAVTIGIRRGLIMI
jgi:DNA-binding NarL/FixJ family response regulator